MRGDAGWTAARRTLFVALPVGSIVAGALSCGRDWIVLPLVLSALAGLLVGARTAAEPWYTEMPLAGYARWGTAVFLTACIGGWSLGAATLAHMFLC